MNEPTNAHTIAVVHIATAARLLLHHDLPGLIDAIERADSFGAILDPTLYRAKQKAMHEDKEIFEAALPLWRLGRRLLDAELAQNQAGYEEITTTGRARDVTKEEGV